MLKLNVNGAQFFYTSGCRDSLTKDLGVRELAGKQEGIAVITNISRYFGVYIPLIKIRYSDSPTITRVRHLGNDDRGEHVVTFNYSSRAGLLKMFKWLTNKDRYGNYIEDYNPEFHTMLYYRKQMEYITEAVETANEAYDISALVNDYAIRFHFGEVDTVITRMKTVLLETLFDYLLFYLNKNPFTNFTDNYFYTAKYFIHHNLHTSWEEFTGKDEFKKFVQITEQETPPELKQHFNRAIDYYIRDKYVLRKGEEEW